MGDRSKNGKSSGQLTGVWIGRTLCVAMLILSLFSSVVFAAAEQLTTTLTKLYCDLSSIIPIVAFVLFVLSGVSYAAGQFFGAEMRARAITWSMSMLTGAIIGLLITQFAQIIITNLIPTATIPSCK